MKEGDTGTPVGERGRCGLELQGTTGLWSEHEHTCAVHLEVLMSPYVARALGFRCNTLCEGKEIWIAGLGAFLDWESIS